jgi:hypothetical protein
VITNTNQFYIIQKYFLIHKINLKKIEIFELGCQIPISFPKKFSFGGKKKLKVLIMSTKYGRYTNFVSINWLKQNVRFQYEVTSNVQRVCIVPYCFLVQFMQHFIMHKIPPKTVSRGACFQNSPTPSASFLCVEINMVLEFLVFMIPGGYLAGVKEK